jgi:hypothetical protein
VMTKSWMSAGGNNYPKRSLFKPPRPDTQALSPAGVFGGMALVRLAAKASRPRAPSAPVCSTPSFFLSLQTGCDMGSINKTKISG